MTQRFFVAPSFEIYGGVAGLYDLGPPGCAIKANLLSFWRQHFVLEENMLEIDCSSITPEPVLKTSGHVAKFSDLMVKDVKTSTCYRADHLLEQHLEKLLEAKNLSKEKIDEYKSVIAQADSYSPAEMGEMMIKYAVKAPDTGNDISEPEPFNLMFSTMIGPSGYLKGFLRPETAQGMFVNFQRLLEYNGGKLPFAASQIGQAFRNEIAPRSGLLRVREFTLAEIEHFVNPSDKKHPKFANLSHLVLTLFPREDQLTTKVTRQVTVGEAVKIGMIANETLGYFIARTYLFLTGAGIKKDRLRFRQHLKDEMAHYATDCWDAEIQNSYGWIECVGIADRACFDLNAHSIETKKPLTAFVEFQDGPKIEDAVNVKLNKSAIGKIFKKKGEILNQYLNALAEENVSASLALQDSLEKGPTKVIVGSEEFEITSELVSFEKTKKKILGKHITPGVIEPSFGIGRILYSLLEHSYYERENDEQRRVLALPPAIAPVKVSVLPLTQFESFLNFIPKITSLLTTHGISCKVDETGQSIGRRYARTDEIGIPFGLTIDHETVSNNTITLRDRDTTSQVRVKIEEIVSLLLRLINRGLIWEEVQKTFPKVEVKE